MSINKFDFKNSPFRGLGGYLSNEAPQMAARETLRFIDDNFRLQGWQGASFQPWAPVKRSGAILSKTGALRLSFNYAVNGAGEVYFYSSLPYAKAQNEGFQGAVNVNAYTRIKNSSTTPPPITKRQIKAAANPSGEIAVNAYTRNMNIIQRQFAPTNDSQSPVLIDAITRKLENDIKAILTF